MAMVRKNGYRKGSFIKAPDGLDRIPADRRDRDDDSHSQSRQGVRTVSAQHNDSHIADAGHKSAGSNEGRAQRLAQEFDTAQQDMQTLLDKAKARILTVVQQELRYALLEEILSYPEELHTPQAGDLGTNGGHALANAHVPQQPLDEGTPSVQTDVEASPGMGMEALSIEEGSQPNPQVAEDVVLCSSESVKSGTTTESLQELAETQHTSLKTQESTVQAKDEPSRREEMTARPDQSSDGEIYEGTVRLSIVVGGCVKEVLRFVDTLCRKPQLRLLRLLGNHNGGMDLWVGLRQPLELKSVLLNMNGVTQVSNIQGSGPKGSETHLSIQLADAS